MNSITFYLFLIPILALIFLAVNFIFAPHNPYQEKSSTFECGFHSFLGQNRTQFSISFFVFALLFLVFDLELVMVLPGFISISTITKYGISFVIILLGILTAGFVFEIGKKALSIDSRQYSNTLHNSFVNSPLILQTVNFFTKFMNLLYFKLVILNENIFYNEKIKLNTYTYIVFFTPFLFILSYLFPYFILPIIFNLLILSFAFPYIWIYFIFISGKDRNKVIGLFYVLLLSFFIFMLIIKHVPDLWEYIGRLNYNISLMYNGDLNNVIAVMGLEANDQGNPSVPSGDPNAGNSGGGPNKPPINYYSAREIENREKVYSEVMDYALRQQLEYNNSQVSPAKPINAFDHVNWSKQDKSFSLIDHTPLLTRLMRNNPNYEFTDNQLHMSPRHPDYLLETKGSTHPKKLFVITDQTYKDIEMETSKIGYKLAFPSDYPKLP